MSINITALFSCLDDFCKIYEEWEAHQLIPSGRKRRRTGKLALSEMLFIMVLFHLDAFKNFKMFYLYGICHKHRSCFKALPTYDRFVALMPRLFMPLTDWLLAANPPWAGSSGSSFMSSSTTREKSWP